MYTVIVWIIDENIFNNFHIFMPFPIRRVCFTHFCNTCVINTKFHHTKTKIKIKKTRNLKNILFNRLISCTLQNRD